MQVLGVDESDIVKTDGAYIYLLRPQRLLVARIIEGAAVEFVGELAFAGRRGAQQLLIAGGKQLALRQLNSNDSYSVRGRAELLEIDISEPARPQLLRELDLDGWILSARLVGSRSTRSTIGAPVPGASATRLTAPAHTVPLSRGGRWR